MFNKISTPIVMPKIITSKQHQTKMPAIRFKGELKEDTIDLKTLGIKFDLESLRPDLDFKTGWGLRFAEAQKERALEAHILKIPEKYGIPLEAIKSCHIDAVKFGFDPLTITKEEIREEERRRINKLRDLDTLVNFNIIADDLSPEQIKEIKTMVLCNIHKEVVQEVLGELPPGYKPIPGNNFKDVISADRRTLADAIKELKDTLTPKPPAKFKRVNGFMDITPICEAIDRAREAHKLKLMKDPITKLRIKIREACMKEEAQIKLNDELVSLFEEKLKQIKPNLPKHFNERVAKLKEDMFEITCSEFDKRLEALSKR